MEVFSVLIFFSKNVSLFLQFLPISLNIFQHQIFSCELIMVWVVIDHPAVIK